MKLNNYIFIYYSLFFFVNKGVKILLFELKFAIRYLRNFRKEIPLNTCK